MPILEISVISEGNEHRNISSYLATVCQATVDSGIGYQAGEKSAILEGDLDRIMEVAKQMHKKAFMSGAEQVVTNITINDNHDREPNLLQEELRSPAMDVYPASQAMDD